HTHTHTHTHRHRHTQTHTDIYTIQKTTLSLLFGLQVSALNLLHFNLPLLKNNNSPLCISLFSTFGAVKCYKRATFGELQLKVPFPQRMSNDNNRNNMHE